MKICLKICCCADDFCVDGKCRAEKPVYKKIKYDNKNEKPVVLSIDFFVGAFMRGNKPPVYWGKIKTLVYENLLVVK